MGSRLCPYTLPPLPESAGDADYRNFVMYTADSTFLRLVKEALGGDIVYNEEKIKGDVKAFKKKNKCRLELIGSGRHRETFRILGNPKMSKWVLKVPASGVTAIEANREEAALYKKYRLKRGKTGVRYAPCRLIPGTDLLLMMKVKRISYKKAEEIPWSHDIDCRQIGVLPSRKRKTVVAFDYGMDV